MGSGPSVSHHADAGRKGAATRWGERRRVNLADLTNEQRRLVLALIEAARVANAEKAGEAQAAQ